MGGGVSLGVVELGFGSVGRFGVGAVAETGGFGGGRVGEGGCEGVYEGVGVCMDGHRDREVAGKWWVR